MSEEADAGGTEVPSHRACQLCRASKVRCTVDEASADSCQRCLRAGKTCVFTPLQKRRQRKRTDTRVAELEKEMRQMRAALQRKEQSSDVGQHGISTMDAAQTRDAMPRVPQNRDVHSASDDVRRNIPQLWPSRFANKPTTGEKDVIDSGVISMATARQLFETFRRDLCSVYPIVVFPESTNADEVRENRPALFLAVIAAAAGKDNSDLAAVLDKEVLHVYATRHMMNSEKSLDLVQALLVSAAWYHPPTKFGQLKYYEYAHMATTMAMELGICSRPALQRPRLEPQPGRGRVTDVHPLEDARNPDLSMTPRSRHRSPLDTLESRRTYIACFVACTGLSLSLRRPNILRVNSYLKECFDYLDNAAGAATSDRVLVAWGRLSITSEGISTAFLYDDSGAIASIAELRTQLMLKDFERKLSSWFTDTLNEGIQMPESLLIIYYGVRMYLHELALHVDHSPEDFQAPFQMGPVHPWTNDETPPEVLAGAVADCITSSHNLMKAFMSTDPAKARGFPVIIFVRIAYSCFVLVKLSLSVSSPKSRIGKLIDRESLKTELYLDRSILHVRAVVGLARCRVPAIFLALLFKLRQWCLNPQLVVGEQRTFAGVNGDAATESNVHFASRPDTRLASKAYGGVNESDVARTQQLPPEIKISVPAKPHESIAAYATTAVPELDPVMIEVLSEAPSSGYDSHNQSSELSGDLTATATLRRNGRDPAVPATPADSADAMELDAELLQFFDEMSAMSQGALAGNEDWSAVLDFADLPPLPENFDWQSSAGFYEAPT